MKHRLEEIAPGRWHLPRRGAMRTDGLIFADHAMVKELQQQEALSQVANVATLPGIVGPAIAMPDIHWGYGFPIGGVAAFDAQEGVISPGGVGYDINCGVRLLRSNIEVEALRPQLKRLADDLFRAVPSGVGAHRSDMQLNDKTLKRVLEEGAGWAIRQGYGREGDLEHCEAYGTIDGADPERLSSQALERGKNQLGTLGSGNHFVEIGYVETIADTHAGAALGLFPGQVTVSIHSGSRGLGYQVCEDALPPMLAASRRYGIELPDRQLCCAPLSSPEGKGYLGAMNAAANFAFANRQFITDQVRQSFARVFSQPEAAMRLNLIYDLCHNIARMEKHQINGVQRRLCVHRKGASRAYPPGHPETPAAYRSLGQPVVVPGDMGRYSYLLLGTAGALQESFASTCHGAGRRLSRQAAKRAARGRNIPGELAAQGIELRTTGRETIAEEIPEAYKDVREVVGVMEQAGLGRIVARLRPLAVIKG
ncbi:MAG: RNA-splicing ligase RtcB [Desulfuromonas sp.]|nr:MAG: RNA-splicing ligase RtcB [Desulfuromonas sp.]